MTNQLPEAGGVAYADLFTDEGIKICVTARAETPGMAIKTLLAAIDESGLSTHRIHPNTARQVNEPTNTPPPYNEMMNEHEANMEAYNLGASNKPVSGRDWGLIDRKPKASDLNFGDRYEIQVDEYKATASEIKFYRKGMEYPDLTHNMLAEYTRNRFNELFKGWMPIEDDTRHDIPNGSVIIAVQCTDADKQTKQGNPYQNLDGMRRP